MPVPRPTSTTSDASRAAPARCSPQSAQVLSLSTLTGNPVASCSSRPTGSSTTPGRFGANRSMPSRSTRPGTPAPTPMTSSCPRRSSPMTPSIASTTASPPDGVGTRDEATTEPASSTTTPSTLVPPTSTPIVVIPMLDSARFVSVAEQGAHLAQHVEVGVADTDLDLARLRQRLFDRLLDDVVDRGHLDTVDRTRSADAA